MVLCGNLNSRVLHPDVKPEAQLMLLLCTAIRDELSSQPSPSFTIPPSFYISPRSSAPGSPRMRAHVVSQRAQDAMPPLPPSQAFPCSNEATSVSILNS